MDHAYNLCITAVSDVKSMGGFFYKGKIYCDYGMYLYPYYDIACRNTCRVMDDSGNRVSDFLFICGYELVSLFSQGLPGTQPLLCNNRRMPYDESFGCGI